MCYTYSSKEQAICQGFKSYNQLRIAVMKINIFFAATRILEFYSWKISIRPSRSVLCFETELKGKAVEHILGIQNFLSLESPVRYRVKGDGERPPELGKTLESHCHSELTIGT